MNKCSRFLVPALGLLAGGVTSLSCIAAETTTLSAIRRELDADALFYTHIDFEGGWGKVGQDINAALKGTSMERMDIAGALSDLGIAQIRGVGMSSGAVEGGYDNRFFLHTPEGRAGFFSVFPGAPEPFAAANLAPADADLIMDVRLDVPSVMEIGKKLFTRFAPDHPEVTAAWDEFSKTEVGFSRELRLFTGRLAVVARMRSVETLAAGQQGKAKNLPFDLLVWAERGGVALEKELVKADKFVRTVVGSRSIFTPKPDADAGQDDYVIIIEDAKIAAGFPQAFVEECLARKSGGLAETTDYRKALSETATQGHMLVYVTPKFFNAVRDVSKWYFTMHGLAQGRSLKDTLMMNQFVGMLPVPPKPLTSVLVARPDGILVRGYSTESLKASLPAVGLLAPDLLGRLATFAVKAWAVDEVSKHARDAVQAELDTRLEQVGLLARSYFDAHAEATSVTLTDLKAAMPNEKVPDFSDVTTVEPTFNRLSDVVAIEHKDHGDISHVMPLTAAQRATIVANIEKLDTAAVERLVAAQETDGSVYGSSLVGDGGLAEPAVLLGENYGDLRFTLGSARTSVTTVGGQEIVFERAPETVLKIRREVTARRLGVEKNLAIFNEAAGKFLSENTDTSAVTVKELTEKGTLPALVPVAGEDYAELSLSRGDDALVFRTPATGQVSYKRPLDPVVLAKQKARLTALEHAAAVYFEKNPDALFVLGGEIYHDEPAPVKTESAEAPVAEQGPDLSSLVIRREYEKLTLTLERDFVVEVMRTSGK